MRIRTSSLHAHLDKASNPIQFCTDNAIIILPTMRQTMCQQVSRHGFGLVKRALVWASLWQ